MNNYQSFQEIGHDLLQEKISCRGLVHHYLQRIEATKKLNVFLEVFAGEAIHHADLIDKKIKNGTAGRLVGMIIGIKTISVIKITERKLLPKC